MDVMLDESPRVVALMGSYHHGGTLDTAVGEVLIGAREAGAETTVLELTESEVEFCRNCRTCTQEPGPERGECVLQDEFDELMRALEGADAIVLGAPVNFGDVNAITRRFLERMLGCAYWPWDQAIPKARREGYEKPSVLVTSSAAPGWMTRFFARPLATLKQMSKLLHAKPVGTLIIGLAATREPSLNEAKRERARALGHRLVAEISVLAPVD